MNPMINAAFAVKNARQGKKNKFVLINEAVESRTKTFRLPLFVTQKRLLIFVYGQA